MADLDWRCEVASREQRRDSGRGRARHRRQTRIAERMGIGPLQKDELDAMHAAAKRLYGVGIGVVVQEEQRFQVIEDSHAGERAAIKGPRRALQALWPWSTLHRLGRAERDARRTRQLWNERIRVIAQEVARQGMGR